MSKINESVKIDIALPLPMPVVGTLMKLIGVAYPTAEIANSHSGLRFLVPANAQPEEIPEDFTPEPSGDNDVNVTQFGPDGISVNTPTELAAICLHVMKKTFEEFPDAKNYLETQCFDRGTGKSYILTFKRNEGKTPHEMRQLAEKERDEARAELEQVQKELKKTKDTLKSFLKESNKKKTVHTSAELHALPVGSVITHGGIIAVKNDDLIWKIANQPLRASEDLCRFSGSWTVLRHGNE